MYGNLPRYAFFALKAVAKTPWWKKILTGAVAVAVPVIATAGTQKAIDKLFRDKKKSFSQKLAELKKLRDSRDITEEEYQKVRVALLDRYGKEG